jgi:hypothetical protein
VTLVERAILPADPAFQRIQPPGKAAAGKIACPTEGHSRNQISYSGTPPRKAVGKLKHAATIVVAAREEMKLL